jgi:tetratricopeptide (TPR) repeat protein
VAVLIYLPTLSHDFVFDDHAVIGLNPLVVSQGDLQRLLLSPYWNVSRHERTLYRPLTSATFRLDHTLAGGLRPGLFHLVNAVLHGLATWLVARLALLLIGGTAAPLFAGLLFAVHPVHVEAVAGIVGRAEILAAAGVLGTLLCHRAAGGAAGRRRAGLLVAAAWSCCLLGVMAKESAIVAPLICLIDGLAFPRTAPAGRRRVILYAGYVGAIALYLGLRIVALGSPGIGGPVPFVDNPAASAGPLAGRLTALGAVARYAALLIWPRHLSADYSFDQIPIVRSPVDPLALAGLLCVALAAGGGMLLLRRRPVAGFALLWIAITSALASNLVVFIGTLLAERLMYLPSVGLCLIFGWLVGAGRGRTAVACLVAGTVVVGAATARTAIRIPEWKDDFALYTSAARVSPRSTRIRYNLGNAHLRVAAFRAAEAEYRAALRIFPAFLDARVNLGMAVLQQGRATEARDLLTAAAAERPRDALLAVNAGTAHRAAGDLSAAEQAFRRALELAPDLPLAWNNLGSVHLARGEAAAAAQAIRRAVDLDPRTVIYQVNLADALLASGDGPEADRRFLEAARIDPDHPEVRRGLGEVAFRRGDVASAEREFRAAAAGTPPSARAANFLGYLLARRGDMAAAAEAYGLAIRIDPTLADAHRSLGLIYADALRDPGRAVLHLEMSLRLEPGQPGARDLQETIDRLRRRSATRP